MLKIHVTRLSQIKLSRMSWLGLAGTVSCCALVLVFGLMLFPSLPQVTYAAIPEVTPSTGTSVGINLPASIDFDSITPTPDGATTTATADLTVTTTNSASYSLYLYSSDGDNSLRPKISANTSSIIATAGGVGLTLSSLKPNTWGYNLGTEAPTDSTTYSAVPTDNSTPIQTKDTSDTNSANDTYTLSFGAKVDTMTASGAYSNTLTIAVVAEPAFVTIAFNGNGADGGSMASLQMLPGAQQTLPSNTFTRSGYVFNGWSTSSNGSGTSYTDGASYTAPAESAGQTITLYAQWNASRLDDISYMQDMTSEICSDAPINDTVRLIDRRDGKYYWVAKLADGNCWMTQNLDLDLSTRQTLTPADSDVINNWTPNRSTVNSASVGDSFPPETEQYSWDFGPYVLSTPNALISCGGSPENFSECSSSAGFVDVSYMEPMAQISDDGTVISNNTYDSHYHIGNYYMWNAATAGTGGELIGRVDAESSICPKGWHLPSGRYSGSRGDFYNLLQQYGMLDYNDGIALAPLYFVRSGDTDVDFHEIMGAGTKAYYWSSTAFDDYAAYYLFFNEDAVNSFATSGYRHEGYSVRCLAD